MAQTEFDPYALLDTLHSGGDVDIIRESVELVLQALIDAEAISFIGAAPHERTDEPSNYRNGRSLGLERFGAICPRPGEEWCLSSQSWPIRCRPVGSIDTMIDTEALPAMYSAIAYRAPWLGFHGHWDSACAGSSTKTTSPLLA